MESISTDWMFSTKTQILYDKTDLTVNPGYRQVFSELREKALHYGLRVGLPSLSLSPYESCNLNSCVIGWNGEVSPCFLLYYDRPYYYFGEARHHPKISFGNVKDRDLFEIWGSRDYRKFRRALQIGDFPSFCDRCLLQNKVLCPAVFV